MHKQKIARVKNYLPAKIVDGWNPAIVAAENEQDNVISILDYIGSDWMGDGVTAVRISKKLRDLGEDTDIVVNINSPGGQVEEGIAIFELLRQHKGHIEVRILSMAASIASVIALAGDEVKISKHGLFMVHDAWTDHWGNSRDFLEVAARLEKTSERIAKVYEEKTNLPIEELRQLMQGDGIVFDGTYMTGEEALALGFVDGLLEPEKVASEDEKNVNPMKVATRALQASGYTRSGAEAVINEIRGPRDAATNPVPANAAPAGTRDAATTAAEQEAVALLGMAHASLQLNLNP